MRPRVIPQRCPACNNRKRSSPFPVCGLCWTRLTEDLRERVLWCWLASDEAEDTEPDPIEQSAALAACIAHLGAS